MIKYRKISTLFLSTVIAGVIAPQSALAQKSAQDYVDQAVTHFQQKELDQALEDLNQAIQLNPNHSKAYFERGKVYFEQDKLDQALQNVNQAIHISSDYTEAYGIRGLVYLKQGKIKKALEEFNQIIQVNPKDAIGYFSRGMVYFKQGKLDKALQDLEKAATLFQQKGEIGKYQKVQQTLNQFRQFALPAGGKLLGCGPKPEINPKIDFELKTLPIVGFKVSPSGLVESTKIIRSSGNTNVDNMAQNWTHTCRFFDSPNGRAGKIRVDFIQSGS